MVDDSHPFDPWLINFLWYSAAVVLMEIDEDGVVTRANRFSRSLLDENPMGKPLKSLIVDFEHKLDIRHLPADGKAIHQLSFGTGQKLPQTCFMRFLRQGNKTLVIGEVHAEQIEQMRHLLVDTNNRLSNLTRDLHKKNADLERLNEIKNQFLGMAAHDLRNPLGAIMLYSDYMLEHDNDTLADQHAEFLNDIRSLSQFMLELINDLLDISAIEAGHLKLDLEPDDLVPLLKNAVSLHQPLAGKKEMDLKLHLPAETLPVQIDANKIRQVLNNLLSNAIKFSPHGAKIEVQATLTEDEIQVAVVDQGPGVKPEEMLQLFKPFIRLSAQATGNEKSTGLGLAICNKILTAHKGRIWAENNPDGGARFFIALPILEL